MEISVVEFIECCLTVFFALKHQSGWCSRQFLGLSPPCFALLHLDAKLFHVGAYVDGLVYLHQPTNCG
jgi:hypothetical protein